MMLESGPTPLYFQLKSIIKAQIDAQELKSGARLPTEAEFCHEYDVSRATVRQALLELEREGFIYRRRGKGTFVTDQEGLKQLSSKGTIENLIAAARGSRFKIIERRMVKAPPHVVKTLGLKDGQKVLRVEAVRLIPKGPVGYSIIHVPPPYAKMITWDDYSEENEFIVFVEETTRKRVYRASQIVSVDLADADVAEHLSMKLNSPVLVIEREYYIREGAALFMSITYNRPDLFQYRVELTRT